VQRHLYLNQKRIFYLLIGLTLSAMVLLAGCGAEPVPAPVEPTQPPVNLPTPTSAPPVATPTPFSTPTLPPIVTKEWASVKSAGADLKTAPDINSATIVRLPGFAIAALQLKLSDESWVERVGGGWLQRQDIVIYKTEEEARRGVPQSALTPSPLPAYAPPSGAGNVRYTYPPIAGAGAVPRQLPTTAPPKAAPNVPGAKPTPTGVPPTIPPTLPFSIPPFPTSSSNTPPSYGT
jgi:hypothetical protein